MNMVSILFEAGLKLMPDRMTIKLWILDLIDVKGLERSFNRGGFILEIEISKDSVGFLNSGVFVGK